MPRIFELRTSEVVDPGDATTHPVRGTIRFSDADTIHLDLWCQGRTFQRPGKGLIAKRDADGRFRGTWEDVIGVADDAHLEPRPVAFAIDILIDLQDDDDMGEFDGSWIEEGISYAWRGDLVEREPPGPRRRG